MVFICYTGEGAIQSGNHTKKEFLTIMDKLNKKKCAIHKKSLKCNSCKKSKKMNTNLVKKQIKTKNYKMSKKTENKLVKQMNKCKKCKNKRTKKCNFKNYLKYSGAERGVCNTSK